MIILFKFCSIASALLPLSVGYKKSKALLWYYPLMALLFDLTTQLTKYVLKVPHIPVSNLFLLVEFVIVTLIYRKIVAAGGRTFSIFLTAGVLFFGASTFQSGVKEFNVASAALFSFCYISLGVFGLYSILKRQQVLFLEKSWFFWLNTGLILYASGNFLIFLFTGYLKQHDLPLFKNLWAIFWGLNITKNLFLSFALYWYPEDERPE